MERNLNQDVTHWVHTGSDGYGGFTFSSPALLKARWEDKAELFRNEYNEEQVSHAVVYTLIDVNSGDFLGLGDFTQNANPIGVDQVHRVAQKMRTTDLRNLRSVRKVYL
jgi:hypothetical protein